MLLPEQTLARGDILNQGRYWIIEAVSLPKNQQAQGAAWLAADAQFARRSVLIRRVVLPNGTPENAQQILHNIAAHLARLSQHPGFPTVIDIFHERGSYYMVFQHPIGESLASLMARQGGVLPEREIAEYARQLCEMLAILASQRPSLIHGAISPETIIISPNKRQVYLLFLPLFPPDPLAKESHVSGYNAPEQSYGSIQPSSDLYSLAAIIHHAVTGYDPRERLVHFYPPARRLNPVVSTGLELILARELRLSSAQRYAHPAEMYQEITNLIASYPPFTETPPQLIAPPQLDLVAMRKQRQKRNLRNTVITATVICAILLALSLGLLFQGFSNQVGITNGATATSAAQQAAFNQELQQEFDSFQKKGIGISDGRLAFDLYPGRTDIDQKKKAATALQQDDMSTAVNLLREAVGADTIDGEAQIYNEDIHLLQNNAPYVTIVLGEPIDGSDQFLNRNRVDMEAVYLAQHEINSKNMLPHGLKLRVLIANSSGDSNNVAAVAQFIADRVTKLGNPDHIIAVVGWPTSSRTINARDIIAGAHIPLIASTASSTALSGSSPYFFRVNPADDGQGSTLGTLVASTSATKNILVLHDPNDSYSNSLAEAFAGSVLKSGNKTTLIKDTFTTNITTVAQYQQMVTDAVKNNNIDSVFIAGLNIAAVRVAHAVGEAARANPTLPHLANLKVVGGDALGTGLILGQGNNADAKIARDFPQDMRRLVFTSFANFNEWNKLGVPVDRQPPFFFEWISTYQSSAIQAHAADPSYEGLLIYDAIQVIGDAARQVADPATALTGQAVRDALITIGKNNVPAYQGITGRILFDDKGNPIDKAIVVLNVIDNGKGGNTVSIDRIIGTFR